MGQRVLTCIGCPMGCTLYVKIEDNQVKSVTGNTCMRGDVYARKEVTNPTRIVTTTVNVKGGGVDPVKTKEDIPKGKVMDCVKELKQLEIEPPVLIGQIIVEDVADTGIPVITTSSIN